jgi:hypothetical protein
MMLQIHYFNMGEPIADASGAEICIARTPPRNTPQHPTTWVALKFELPAHQATDIAGDIHLIKTQPHMHARGVRLDTNVRMGVAKR